MPVYVCVCARVFVWYSLCLTPLVLLFFLPKCVLISVNSSFLLCFVFSSLLQTFCLCLCLVFVICSTVGVICFFLSRDTNTYSFLFQNMSSDFFYTGSTILQSDCPLLCTLCLCFKAIDGFVCSTVFGPRDEKNSLYKYVFSIKYVNCKYRINA